MYCTNCGKKLQEDDKFCSNCGKAVGRTAQKENDLSGHSEEIKQPSRMDDSEREASADSVSEISSIDARQALYKQFNETTSRVETANSVTSIEETTSEGKGRTALYFCIAVAIACIVLFCVQPSRKNNLVGTWERDLYASEAYYGYEVLEFYKDGSFIIGDSYSGYYATGDYKVKRDTIEFKYMPSLSPDYDLWGREIGYTLKNDNDSLIITRSANSQSRLARGYQVIYRRK